MKILQVFDIFSPQGGGTAESIRKLSLALIKGGHEVTIYTTDYKLDKEYIKSLKGIKVYPFHCLSSLAGFYFTPDITGTIKKELSGFNIIHLHCFRSYQNILIHRYASKYSIPYIVDAHGSLSRVIGGKSRLKALLKWFFDLAFGFRILKDAKRVIAETETGISEYEGLGVKRDRVAVIAPPFAIEDFSHLPPPGLFRQKYSLQNKKLVLFLGRIHYIKGLDFLVESFYELIKSRNNVILAIVGNDDGYKLTLEKLVNKLALSEKVLFPGFLFGNEKLSALVDADVVVQTSRYEHGTVVPFEAVLCNTPIIVSKNTSASENVRKIDAGYLVEYGNKQELKETLQYVLDHPDEARQKTQKAKEYIEANLSSEKVIEKYEHLYAECIAR
jgi:glycosyltransferase involved in cell wall biosynthesis